MRAILYFAGLKLLEVAGAILLLSACSVFYERYAAEYYVGDHGFVLNAFLGVLVIVVGAGTAFMGAMGIYGLWLLLKINWKAAKELARETESGSDQSNLGQ